MSNRIRKIALVKPPLTGHETRGIGFYASKLFESLATLDAKTFDFSFIPLKALKSDYDLVHFPYFDLFFLTMPFFQKSPFVITVHDLIPLIFPEKYPKGLKGYLKWQIQRLKLRRSAAIITDSQTSAKDITRLINLSPEKIYPIGLGSDPIFNLHKDTSSLNHVKTKFDLPKQYVLYVGDVNYNKNLPNLIGAFFRALNQLPNLRLVFVGASFQNKNLPEVQNILALIGKYRLQKLVKFVGFVDTSELSAIYNLASVYCQVSFCEGFGLPVLEAMNSGCIVVCSQIPALEEITGPNALFVNPYDPQNIAQGIVAAINTPHKKNFTKKAWFYASKFTWEKTARLTLDVYEKILR